ncbi:cation:proton antiporter regulatory subunit [Candidatus Formimonas warabiya]|uniref:Potassium:proton antiporter n=1 Tax=Formimonas warabiya TaxID=1761012 RepID=A0A3G1KVL9_FORW1|nr:cation:proton antiporter regulatory subunit [Candidatus Formimonas warabiya]ATW26460.1 potassium:proton antiporter [Candidatus Formimonas warabiya]
MFSIHETELPGIGQKFVIKARSGDKLVVIIHDDGRREMYHFAYDDPDDSISMITLDDNEARQVAAIVGGIIYKPKALETIEVALDDLVIEWIKMEPDFPCLGKTIGELEVRKKTGATIIALVGKDHAKVLNPGPEHVFKEGTTVVIIGEKEQVKKCRYLIAKGGV